MNRRLELQQEARPAGSDACGDGGKQNRGDGEKKGRSEELDGGLNSWEDEKVRRREAKQNSQRLKYREETKERER